jgi:hypothetical protein
MTLADRLRTRHRATVYLADDERLNDGEPCACSGCDDARAVLAFVPGEVEAPAGFRAVSPGYWNRTRRLFPDVFARRAHQSRLIGARLARVGGARTFLDELPDDADAPDDQIECGPVCQMSLFGDAP